MNSHHIYNLPNFVSSIRILVTPLLFYFAINQQPYWFIGAIIFSEFTDVLDGFLARRMHQITELGSRLDSWGDFMIYTSMAVCGWILWPDIMKREVVPFTVIVLSFTMPGVVGLIKFRTITSYHTWSVKVAVVAAVLSYLLLVTGLLDWPFTVAAVICAYAAIEEILITLLIHHEHVDVKTIWQALRYNRIDDGIE